jgi:hypothetical protein
MSASMSMICGVRTPGNLLQSRFGGCSNIIVGIVVAQADQGLPRRELLPSWMVASQQTL